MIIKQKLSTSVILLGLLRNFLESIVKSTSESVVSSCALRPLFLVLSITVIDLVLSGKASKKK
jgi:hypothetical protein